MVKTVVGVFGYKIVIGRLAVNPLHFIAFIANKIVDPLIAIQFTVVTKIATVAPRMHVLTRHFNGIQHGAVGQGDHHSALLVKFNLFNCGTRCLYRKRGPGESVIVGYLPLTRGLMDAHANQRVCRASGGTVSRGAGCSHTK